MNTKIILIITISITYVFGINYIKTGLNKEFRVFTVNNVPCHGNKCLNIQHYANLVHPYT